VNRSSRRLGPITFLLLGLVLAACSSAAGTNTNATAEPVTARPTGAVAGTTAEPQTPSLEPTQPGLGNVDGTYPELSVELVGGAYRVAVTDPAAKAWRIQLMGVGSAAGDGIELIVEVGDVAPGAGAWFLVGGQYVDTFEFGSLLDMETAAAGGCHPTLEICVGSNDIAIDPATGTVTVDFEAVGDAAVVIQGATAVWPEEPFVLGDWRTTAVFGGS
jgi:hypothetical protein